MRSAYAAPASPPRLATPETKNAAANTERITAVLAELAAPTALHTRTNAPIRFVDAAEQDPCSVCPEVGTVADADAVLCWRGPESGYVYREPSCAEHLADAVGYTLRTSDREVWVEVPVRFLPPVPSWSGCECDPTRGQTCPVCNGALAEQAGVL